MNWHFRSGKLVEHRHQSACREFVADQPGRQLAETLSSQDRLDQRLAIAEFVADVDLLGNTRLRTH